MSIGFACLTIAVQNTDFKSCIIKHCSEEKFLSVVKNNLTSLYNILNYNQNNNINLFRISSDLIPFGSHEDIPVRNWEEYFEEDLLKIREIIKKTGIRLSMHPGQYTVLNSPSEDIVKRAVRDLEYHDKVLSLLNVNGENKIILHVGGVYGNKKVAIDRFKSNYKELSQNIKDRLVIENDDKLFNILDVLEIGNDIGIPVVYDNLHNECNKIIEESDSYWITEAGKTWKKSDGKQKIHYSQQNPEKKQGAHSETIDSKEFLTFYNSLSNKDIDIMLEVKDKNISAVKCNNILDPIVKNVDADWGRYKYLVMQKSEKIYSDIKTLMRDKKMQNVSKIYTLIEEAFSLPDNIGQFVNSSQHVWGYFKTKADEKEKSSFLSLINGYQRGIVSDKMVKKELWRLSRKYNEDYLIDSYYFNEVR
ncbi:MAG: UV DNA damage endonuclease [Firmicutes bacterium ADurb.Bin080]|jgi:UV DNA damage endonuclease|nr:UV DNA damage repair endonuclease UvsE [Clostridiales bacterium]OQC11868.1 MAG: UV DNA damage endonuclease [Firmicutes bacterium ADurb.Bin080]